MDLYKGIKENVSKFLTYFYNLGKLTIIRLDSYQLSHFLKLLEKYYEEINNQTSISNFDTIQISRLKLISINLFFMMEDLTINKDSSTQKESQEFLEKVQSNAGKILDELFKNSNDPNVNNDDARRDIMNRTIDSIVRQKANTLVPGNLKQVKQKLFIIKQRLVDSSVTITENLYFFIPKKLKEAFEVVYLYLNDNENIDSYQTRRIYGRDLRNVENRAKNSLKKISQNGSSDNSTLIDNIATYVAAKMNNEEKIF